MWPFLRREEIKVLGTVLKRLAQGIFVTFCVIFISFVILRMIPGDPAAAGDQRQYGTGKVHPGAV